MIIIIIIIIIIFIFFFLQNGFKYKENSQLLLKKFPRKS